MVLTKYFKKPYRWLWQLAGVSMLPWLLLHCTVSERALETPPPQDNIFAKDFFQNPDGTPKTFLFGAAAQTWAGGFEPFAGYNFNIAMHANVIFQVTEDFLIGKEVNPSRPDEPEFWAEIIKIPIRSHFYLEKRKDPSGREVEELIENTGRSHWSARDYIKLDLKGMTLTTNRYRLICNPKKNPSACRGPITFSHVSDIEIDQKLGQHFLAFTASASSVSAEWGSHNQAQFRVNFLEYKTNSQFEKVPYHDQNSKYLNTLHVIGKQTNGRNQILYTARWDLENRKLPIPIRLHGFPKEYLDIAEDSIREWNIAFTQAMQPQVENPRENFTKYFKGEVSTDQHPFDLRYPTMRWVSDIELSAYGPLGVGLAHADVNNGEILWGNVTLYGAFLENYVSRSMPTSEVSMGGGQAEGHSESAMIGLPASLETMTQGLALGQIPEFLNPATAFSAYQVDSLANHIGHFMPLLNIDSMANDEQPLSPLRISEAELAREAQTRAQAVASHLQQHLQGFAAKNNQLFSPLSYEDIWGFKVSGPDSHKQWEQEDPEGYALFEQGIIGRDIMGNFGLDRRLIDIAPELEAAFQQEGVNFQQALRVTIKKLILHELGHMFGLGHQFKSHVVPERGTVPDKYIDGDPKSHSEAGQLGLAALATEDKHFTNMTSVMGYFDPRSQVRMAYEDVVPGPHDLLAVRYIYRGEYPVYKEGESDFRFAKVPESGAIPPYHPEHPEYKTAFFPSCTDWDVNWSGDPYCDRWVRGSRVQDIVKNYFRSLTDGLTSTLFAFTNESSGVAHERWLWIRSLRATARMRIFYDYMRQKYAQEIEEIASDERNLYEFYPACSGASGVRNARLEKLFSDHPYLKELCQVNGQVIAGFESLMSLGATDFTRYDFSTRYIHSGIRGGDIRTPWWRAFDFQLGAWTELTALPLKIASLYNLTTSQPYMAHQVWTIPLRIYSNAQGRYSYASLYPNLYLEALTSAVAKNMKFAYHNEDHRTVVGKLALSAGGFSRLNVLSNDSLIIPDSLQERVRNHTAFHISQVAVILKEHFKQGDTSKVTHFSGSIFDFRTQEATPAEYVYVLPNRKFLVKANESTFILPVSDIRFFGRNKDDKGMAFGFAFKVEYDRGQSSRSSSLTIHQAFSQYQDMVLRDCVEGLNNQRNGLANYFNQNFAGFEYSGNIGGQPIKQEEFFDSVDQAFDDYYSRESVNGYSTPDRRVCQETMRGMKALVGTAASLQGYFLWPLLDVMEMD